MTTEPEDHKDEGVEEDWLQLETRHIPDYQRHTAECDACQ